MVKITYDTSEETRIKEIARLREKALHDEASALKHAREEGRAEGIKEGLELARAEAEKIGMEIGRAKERANAISRMRALGFTEEQIKAVFG